MNENAYYDGMDTHLFIAMFHPSFITKFELEFFFYFYRIQSIPITNPSTQNLARLGTYLYQTQIHKIKETKKKKTPSSKIFSCYEIEGSVILPTKMRVDTFTFLLNAAVTIAPRAGMTANVQLQIPVNFLVLLVQCLVIMQCIFSSRNLNCRSGFILAVILCLL